MKRYLTEPIRQDLLENMVFLGGPRQVGKTTFALSLIPGADETHPAYLSWDVPEHQRLLLKGGLPTAQQTVILDEIHKYKRWRNLLKGFYDRHKSHIHFLVTGSARLDH
jgi:predicted AAA+ superfamily ATPase